MKRLTLDFSRCYPVTHEGVDGVYNFFVGNVLPEFTQKVKNAGLDAINAEHQKQLDTWTAKK